MSERRPPAGARGGATGATGTTGATGEVPGSGPHTDPHSIPQSEEIRQASQRPRQPERAEGSEYPLREGEIEAREAALAQTQQATAQRMGTRAAMSSPVVDATGRAVQQQGGIISRTGPGGMGISPATLPGGQFPGPGGILGVDVAPMGNGFAANWDWSDTPQFVYGVMGSHAGSLALGIPRFNDKPTKVPGIGTGMVLPMSRRVKMQDFSDVMNLESYGLPQEAKVQLTTDMTLEPNTDPITTTGNAAMDQAMVNIMATVNKLIAALS